MNKLLYFTFFSIFTVDYLGDVVGRSARYLAILPEVLSLIVLIVVILEAIRTKNFFLGLRYQIFLFLSAVLIIVGVIINEVSPGTIFVGVRNYLKFLPFFLLPAVWSFSKNDIEGQLKFVLGLAVAQLPLVIYQKFVQFKGVHSGDVISGTLNVSSILSLTLIAAIALVFSFYLKNRLKFRDFIIFLLCLFIPTTLNETKGTLVLLPIVLFLPVWLSGRGWQKLWQFATVGVLGMILLGVFSYSHYEFFAGEKHGSGGVIDLFTSSDRLIHYLYGGAADEDIRLKSDADSGLSANQIGSANERVGRIDAVLLPIRVLSEDKIKLMVGLGIGNVSKSFFGQFAGEYVGYVALGAGRSALAQLLWETGLLGVLLSLLFFYYIYMDANHLKKDDGIYGALSLGWMTVVAIMVISLPYKNILTPNVIGYLFWYFSGVVAAKRFVSDQKY